MNIKRPKLVYILPAIIFVVWFFFGKAKDSNGYTIYEIKKNKHYANINFGLVNLDDGVLTFDFDITGCEYDLKDEVEQLDINKLFGFSEGLDHHHNSARFGWNYNPFDRKFYYYSYTYVDGERQYKFIASGGSKGRGVIKRFEGMDLYSFKLYLDGEKYTEIVPSGKDVSGDIKIKLHPYFGGDNKSTKDMILKINVL